MPGPLQDSVVVQLAHELRVGGEATGGVRHHFPDMPVSIRLHVAAEDDPFIVVVVSVATIGSLIRSEGEFAVVEIGAVDGAFEDICAVILRGERQRQEQAQEQQGSFHVEWFWSHTTNYEICKG
ncbi:MAG TPA: hypothetical protein PLX35_04255 [Cyclobacteriaceae bacterium]|nr:hypothetical protein [Cyclobacteriaceae bacterium]